MKLLVVGSTERTVTGYHPRIEVFHTKLDAEVAARTWGNNKYYEVSASHEMVYKAEWISKCL